MFLKILPLILIFFLFSCGTQPKSSAPAGSVSQDSSGNSWIDRTYLIQQQFNKVYTPAWEGANGAIGDAYLFRVTNDSSIFLKYRYQFDLKLLNNGTWVDDRAWACLAELYWWEFTGKKHMDWVKDAVARYVEARNEGRLSNAEGYWTWYNYPPNAQVNEEIITNSNMNQMVTVACRLFLATGDRRFLDDALLAWNGDSRSPGIEKTFYRGNGTWSGKGGLAAFGKQLPWESASYLSVLTALYQATGDPKYKQIAVASAKHILDPKTGWIDSVDCYQIRMDGNGAFVHFLLDAYEIAPVELAMIPPVIERMLEHVWTNNHGKATVQLHRLSDHGIRNGWNPHGGEDGYGVDEVGTKHAQSQALRAFGVFTYFNTLTQRHKE